MLEVHFTAEDLTNVGMCPFPSPLVELKVSLMMSRRPDSDVLHGRWRRRLRRSLPGTTAPLWDLVFPYIGPAFMDPVSRTLGDGLVLVRESSPSLVRSNIELLYCLRQAPVPPWLRELIGGSEESWTLLHNALRDAYTQALGPTWPVIQDLHRAEFTTYALAAAEFGVAGALTAVVPGSEFSSGVWRLPSPFPRTVHLGGRGLTLLPTFHWTGAPLRMDEPDERVLIVYPAGTGIPVLDPDADGDPLAVVLGHTRSAVLRLLADEHTTTQVARLAGISMGSASGHTRALRNAGLISTVREGTMAVHRRTALGALLAGER